MKTVKIILLNVLLLFVCIGCSTNKKEITADEFKEKMRDNDYYVVDVTEQFSEYDYIEKCLLAIDITKSYQIEFYKLKDSENALEFYRYNKGIFQASEISGSVYKSVDLSSSNKYTLKTFSSYKIISRIKDTVIYVDVDVDYKDSVDFILQKIGY